MAERIFLSYAYADREIANQVEKVLREGGLVANSDLVIVDPRKATKAGESIREAIRDQMMTANKVVIVISANSAQSHWVSYEAGMASALGKPVYVLVCPGTEQNTLLEMIQASGTAAVVTLPEGAPSSPGPDAFDERVRRGRRFEAWERSWWNVPVHEGVETEAPTVWEGRRGRIDLRLVDEEEGHTVVVETKATDWDKMAAHRVRPNALRHARQLWRYIDAELESRPVLPAIVYPAEPCTPGRKQEIEAILHERSIQVVWRELDLDDL